MYVLRGVCDGSARALPELWWDAGAPASAPDAPPRPLPRYYHAYRQKRGLPKCRPSSHVIGTLVLMGLHAQGDMMLRWAIVFLVVALVAAVLGFSGIAADAAWIAKILFVVFLVLFVVSLLFKRSS